MINKIQQVLIDKILNPRWIVSAGEDPEELGIEIFGLRFYYYKWPEPLWNQKANFRYAGKREFGEVIKTKKSYQERK